MQQTIYIIGAILILALISFHQQRSIIRTQLDMIEDEIDFIATGVISEQFDLIATRSFDAEADVSSASELTPANDFGAGTSTWDEAADIDDYHDKTDTVTVNTESGAIEFTVEATVEYVSGTTFESSNTQTYYKQVTLNFSDDEGTVATISRIFSYKPL
jgi:hypothetical protein